MDEIKTIDLFAKPQRDKNGKFITGNTASVGNAGGNKCEFCPNAKEIVKKVNLYRLFCNGKVNGKKRIPFLEELCDEDYLDILVDQLEDWVRNKELSSKDPVHDPSLHAELARTIAKLFTSQKLWLKKRVLGDKQPTGAIFLLKANHGMIETERQIQSGDKDNPIENKLQIEITEAKRHE